MKYLLVINKKENHIASLTLRELLSYIPNYNPPPEEVLGGRVLRTTMEKIDQERQAAGINPILYANALVKENNCFVILIGTNSKREFIFVQDELFSAPADEPNLDDLNLLAEEILNFLHKSVDFATEKFSTKISGIFYDFDIDFPSLQETAKKRKYLLGKSFKLLLENLNHESGDAIKEICENMKSKSIHEVINVLMNTYKATELAHEPKIGEILSKYLNPLTVGIVYSNPEIRERAFYDCGIEDEEYFNHQYFRFGAYALPSDSRVDFGKYQKKQENFKYMFEDIDNKISSVDEFWDSAQMNFPTLSIFASKLLKIPALLKEIDLENFMVTKQLNEDNDLYINKVFLQMNDYMKE